MVYRGIRCAFRSLEIGAAIRRKSLRHEPDSVTLEAKKVQ